MHKEDTSKCIQEPIAKRVDNFCHVWDIKLLHAIHTDPIPTLCPGAPSGFDHYWYGRAYRSFLNQNTNFNNAQTNCQNFGGALPVLASSEDYLGARAMASTFQR